MSPEQRFEIQFEPLHEGEINLKIEIPMHPLGRGEGEQMFTHLNVNRNSEHAGPKLFVAHVTERVPFNPNQPWQHSGYGDSFIKDLYIDPIEGVVRELALWLENTFDNEGERSLLSYLPRRDPLLPFKMVVQEGMDAKLIRSFKEGRRHFFEIIK